MTSRLSRETEERLEQYLKDIRRASNETACRETFIGLVSGLFPGTDPARGLPMGAERAVRIQLPDREKRGKIDSYYGNAVIEFEYSLKATRRSAEEQLREYCSGIWREETRPYRPLLAVATDGIAWVMFRPKLRADLKGKPAPQDVTLESLREFTVNDKTLADFYYLLNGVLFRTGQIPPTVEQFQQDFGRESFAYSDAMDRIRSAWDQVRDQREPLVALDAWRKYLTTTYGSLSDGSQSSEIEDLFFRHTYLAALARLAVWASLSGGQARGSYAETAKEIFQGTYFESKQIANIVESDFFQWIRYQKAQNLLEPVWEKMIAQIETYDLSQLSQDVLKGVYQELVDPKDRHDLGEYYTPDWLCERIVAELAPQRGIVRTLDPSCGSGSFLRAAIRHFIQHNQDLKDDDLLNAILQNVVGIDVHPLAATIAKATYALALGGLLKSAKRPIQIPVFMADSLFLPKEARQLKIGGILSFVLEFGGKTVEMPDSLIQSPELFDATIMACCKVAESHAVSLKDTPKSTKAYLLKAVPRLAQHPDLHHIVEGAWAFTEGLAALIRERKNSIWSFIVRNSYRPAMLKKSFDLIVGNPPWLSYRYIEDPEYQEEIRALAQDTSRGYRIAPPQKSLFTHMELATVFLAHAMGTFARPNAKLGFVMPRSILNADQHSVLRARRYKWSCRFKLDRYWDLLDVKPVFRVPCIVLFATCTDDPEQFGSEQDPLPVVEWTGKLFRSDIPWVTAKTQLDNTEKTGRLIYLGTRTAWSTGPGRTSPNKASNYKRAFEQGATVVPRSLYFIQPDAIKLPVQKDRLYSIKTDPAQAADAKKPWTNISLTGQADGRFVFLTALSRHVVPFALLQPSLSVLPILPGQHGMKPRTADELRNDGYREFALWISEAESIWRDRRARKADRTSLQDWLDYQSKLTKQSFSSRFMVLYNAPGTNMSSTFFDRRTLDLDLVVEHDLYWTAVATRQEGHYLAAILNSNITNDQIKPFQAGGLLGERHIEKKVLDLPIPKFDEKNNAHIRLAALGAAAHESVRKFTQTADFPTSLAAQRSAARRQVSSIIAAIDELAAGLLPVR